MCNVRNIIGMTSSNGLSCWKKTTTLNSWMNVNVCISSKLSMYLGKPPTTRVTVAKLRPLVSANFRIKKKQMFLGKIEQTPGTYPRPSTTSYLYLGVPSFGMFLSGSGIEFPKILWDVIFSINHHVKRKIVFQTSIFMGSILIFKGVLPDISRSYKDVSHGGCRWDRRCKQWMYKVSQPWCGPHVTWMRNGGHRTLANGTVKSMRSFLKYQQPSYI